VKLSEAEEPARLNATTRRYLREIAKLPDYAWLEPLRRRLDDPATIQSAANQIRARSDELDAMLRTTVAPTMLKAGIKSNVIPNTAEAQVDVRRMPSETREELLDRFHRIINDNEVEVAFAPGSQMPATEPSSVTTPLYRAMERAIARVYPRDIVV